LPTVEQQQHHHLNKPFPSHAPYTTTSSEHTPAGSYTHTHSVSAQGASASGANSGAGASCGEGRSSSSTSSIVSVPALASVGSPARPDSQSDYLVQHRLDPSPAVRDDYTAGLRSVKSAAPIHAHHGPPSVSTGLGQPVSPATTHVSIPYIYTGSA
uniref:ZM domain-containing protein n=1 Tax=Echinostoma caproni TaxID=27848 RepID=A0A183BGB6_9TREM